jgi:hypothetical protein
VHLYYDLAKQKQLILWAKDPDSAVTAAVAKYKARGYEFILPPDLKLTFPLDRVLTISKGTLLVDFDRLYKKIKSYALNFKDEINKYLQYRKAGL